MSTPEIVPLESSPLDLTDDSLEHWFCDCNPDRAMCGADIAGEPETAAVYTPDDCLVCLDLIHQDCERCGQ